MAYFNKVMAFSKMQQFNLAANFVWGFCLFSFFTFTSDCKKKEQDKTNFDELKFFGVLIGWSIFRI